MEGLLTILLQALMKNKFISNDQSCFQLTWFLISFFSFLQFNAIIWENISMLKEYNYSTLWLMKLKEIEILLSQTDFKGVFFFLASKTKPVGDTRGSFN